MSAPRKPADNWEAMDAIRAILDKPDYPSWDRLLDIYELLDDYAGWATLADSARGRREARS